MVHRAALVRVAALLVSSDMAKAEDAVTYVVTWVNLTDIAAGKF
jgi:hypothetical protein